MKSKSRAGGTGSRGRGLGRTFDGGDLLDDGVHPPAIDDPRAHQLACGYTKRGETRGSVRVRDGRAGRGEKSHDSDTEIEGSASWGRERTVPRASVGGAEPALAHPLLEVDVDLIGVDVVEVRALLPDLLYGLVAPPQVHRGLLLFPGRSARSQRRVCALSACARVNDAPALSEVPCGGYLGQKARDWLVAS